VPVFRWSFAIYTNGARPNDNFTVKPGLDVFLGEMGQLVLPDKDDELFGPHAAAFLKAAPRRGFLLAISREGRGRAGSFFDDARAIFLQCIEGLDGWALDVLRLWPFPLAEAEELVPEDVLADDLFAIGIEEMGEHGYRAETYGLAKLDQRELSFTFRGQELLEEAALMVAHIADWVMDHGRRLSHGDATSFGFDRLHFSGIDGGAGGPFRGWHPALIQRLLPESLFPGVGVLGVLTRAGGNEEPEADLTTPLRRAADQRLLLEELDLTGDSPHHTTTAVVRGHFGALKAAIAWRDELQGSKDSGWHFEAAGAQAEEEGVMALGEVARRVPALIRYLALPPGVRLSWDAQGQLALDASRAQHLDEEDDPEA